VVEFFFRVRVRHPEVGRSRAGINRFLLSAGEEIFVHRVPEGGTKIRRQQALAGLLARAGLLDGRRATTNKQVFEWPVSQGPRVNWVRQARWVEDGKFVTSSGISAGIDMALAVIGRRYGGDAAEAIAVAMEYEWHRDPLWDPFAQIAAK
jgi:hypothetical protein